MTDTTSTFCAFRHLAANVGQFRVETMSVEDYLDIPPNPRQRNTELHYARAKSKHLSILSPTHRLCSVAVMPDGSMYKLDGHTRSLAWERGELEWPDDLQVCVYPCSDLDTVKILYTAFDSRESVETAAEGVTGAYRANDLALNSNRFNKGRGMLSALKLAAAWRCGAIKWNENNSVTDDDLVYLFRDQIKTLDELHMSASRREGFTWPAGMLAAAMLSLVEPEASARPKTGAAEPRSNWMPLTLEFIAKVNANLGGKYPDTGQIDMPELVLSTVAEGRTPSGRSKKGILSTPVYHASIFIHAAKKYVENPNARVKPADAYKKSPALPTEYRPDLAAKQVTVAGLKAYIDAERRRASALGDYYAAE